jgi:hypothetical protein
MKIRREKRLGEGKRVRCHDLAWHDTSHDARPNLSPPNGPLLRDLFGLPRRAGATSPAFFCCDLSIVVRDPRSTIRPTSHAAYPPSLEELS